MTNPNADMESLRDVEYGGAVNYAPYRRPQELVTASDLETYIAGLDRVVSGEATAVVYRGLFDEEQANAAVTNEYGFVTVDLSAYPDEVTKAAIATRNNSRMPPELLVSEEQMFVRSFLSFGFRPTELHYDYAGGTPAFWGPNFLVDLLGKAVITLVKMPRFLEPDEYQQFTNRKGFLSDEAREELGAVETVLEPGDAISFTAHQEEELGVTPTLHQVVPIGEGPWLRSIIIAKDIAALR